MAKEPGSIYKVGGRRYVDSQAVLNLAGAHELVPLQDGWRVLVQGGAVGDEGAIAAVPQDRVRLGDVRDSPLEEQVDVHVVVEVGGDHARWARA